MNTWMQMAGVPPEVRRMVGRWSVSQEEEYLRNLEASVTGAQQKVAQMGRTVVRHLVPSSAKLPEN